MITQKVIISTQHIHLDHDNCLEIVAVRGKAKDVQKLTDQIKASQRREALRSEHLRSWGAAPGENTRPSPVFLAPFA